MTIAVYIPLKSIKTQRHRTALASLMMPARVFSSVGANSGWVLLYEETDFYATQSIADRAGIPFNGLPEFNKDIQL